MPYLHYETDEGRQKMTDAMKLVGVADESASSNSTPNMLLLQAYLRDKTKIHPRRTLDQFFYHGLDTTARDRDQVVYRYCESQGEHVYQQRDVQLCSVSEEHRSSNTSQDISGKFSWLINFGCLYLAKVGKLV